MEYIKENSLCYRNKNLKPNDGALIIYKPRAPVGHIHRANYSPDKRIFQYSNAHFDGDSEMFVLI